MGSLAGRRVVVLGLARQGAALVRYLARCGANVTVSDLKGADGLQNEMEMLKDYSVDYRLGGHPLDLLHGAEMLCLSGGIPTDLPIIAEARRAGIPLSNDTQLFLEATPAKVVGITGSAGKTTTTTLVGRMAGEASRAGEIGRAWVGGNIGNPLLDDVDRMRAGDVAIVELSSFQLELVRRSPQVAAVLNITPNHLDRHHTMEAYTEAKARILDFQSAGDAAVLGWEDAASRGLAGRVKGRCAFFSAGRKEWPGEGAFVEGGTILLERGSGRETIGGTQSVLLRGRHNLANAAAACAIGGLAGFSAPAIAGGISGFRGVVHRLEFVARLNGADWYNDSIATAPERAMAAIRSFDEPIVLLAGGRDKKLPWRDWAGLVTERVDHVILFGEAAGLIREALGAAPAGRRPYSVESCATLADAVTAAARTAEPGDVVLLSPGGTSFDAFKDFEQRGESFRSLVLALGAKDGR